MLREIERKVQKFIEDNFLFRDDRTGLSAEESLLDAGLIDSTGILELVAFLENGWEAVVGIFAALKAGAVFCPVNASTKPPKLAYLLDHCRAAALLTQARLWPIAKAALADAPSVALTIVADAGSKTPEALSLEAALAAGRPPPTQPGIDLDLAMLIYTSGSTGRPKGVMMTHQNVVAAAHSITSYLENTADDVILSALPISFDYRLYTLLVA